MSEDGTLALMLAKARRYLDSAEILRQSGDHDSAASRLYYAMFYCAQAVLWERGLKFSRHSAVIAAFGQHFAKTGLLPPELHRWLQDAFDSRNIGDYQFEQTLTERQVLELQRQASDFLTHTEAFLNSTGNPP